MSYLYPIFFSIAEWAVHFRTLHEFSQVYSFASIRQRKIIAPISVPIPFYGPSVAFFFFLLHIEFILKHGAFFICSHSSEINNTIC